MAAGCNHNRVGLFGLHRVHSQLGIIADFHAELFKLCALPSDEGGYLTLPRGNRRQAVQAADTVGTLKERNFMAALSQNYGRFSAGRAAARNKNILFSLCGDDFELIFTHGSGIKCTLTLTAAVNLAGAAL